MNRVMNRAVKLLRTFFIPCEQNYFRPQFFESGIPIVLVVSLFLFKSLQLSLLFSLPATSFFPQLTKEEFIELTNEERRLLGLSPLQRNRLLETAALLKGQDMLARNYFSHTDPEGNPPWYWFQTVGYQYASAGENLAIGFLDAKEAMDAWNSSPSHRANILNPNYKEIGVAVLKGSLRGTETTLVIQLFGAPLAKSLTAIKETEPTKKPGAQVTQPQSLLEPAQPIAEIKEGHAAAESSVLGGQNDGIGAEDAKEVFPKENLSAITISVIKMFKAEQDRALGQLTRFIFLFMALTSAVLIFVKLEIQHPDLIVRSLILLAVVGALLLADREFFLAIIPHQLTI